MEKSQRKADLDESLSYEENVEFKIQSLIYKLDEKEVIENKLLQEVQEKNIIITLLKSECEILSEKLTFPVIKSYEESYNHLSTGGVSALAISTQTDYLLSSKCHAIALINQLNPKPLAKNKSKKITNRII